MKRMGKIPQILIGITPPIIFWIVAGTLQDDLFIMEFFEDFDIYLTHISLFDTISVIMFPCMFLWLYLWSFIGKRFNLDYIYYGSLIGVLLPAVCAFVSTFFTDDGNILSWIYMFTIGLILYPIGRLAYFSFDALDFDIWLESDTLSIIIVIIALLSLPIFKHIKKKQRETLTDH